MFFRVFPKMRQFYFYTPTNILAVLEPQTPTNFMFVRVFPRVRQFYFSYPYQPIGSFRASNSDKIYVCSCLSQNTAALFLYPTNLLAVLGRHNPLIDKLYAVHKRQWAGFEALKRPQDPFTIKNLEIRRPADFA